MVHLILATLLQHQTSADSLRAYLVCMSRPPSCVVCPCRYLVRNDLFEPIVAMFVSNGNRYNMIHSGTGALIFATRHQTLPCAKTLLLLCASIGIVCSCTRS